MSVPDPVLIGRRIHGARSQDPVLIRRRIHGPGIQDPWAPVPRTKDPGLRGPNPEAGLAGLPVGITILRMDTFMGYIRVRRRARERIIEFPGCVDGVGVGHVQDLGVQPRGGRTLTSAACMASLTV